MAENAKKQNLFEVCMRKQAEWNPSSCMDFTDEAIALGIISCTFLMEFLLSIFRSVESNVFYLTDSAESEEEFEILG